jgi:hypothetical protein
MVDRNHFPIKDFQMRKRKPEAEPVQPGGFSDDIATAKFVVGEFKILLSIETSKIEHDRIQNPADFDPQRHSYLHRLRLAAETFGAALDGYY